MKPRTVVVGVEVETDLPLAHLRDARRWKFVVDSAEASFTVRQVLANVVQKTKPERVLVSVRRRAARRRKV